MPVTFFRNCWSSPKGSKPPNQKRAPLQPQPVKLKTHCLNCSTTNLPCPLNNSSTSCASSGPPITRTQPKKPSCPSSPYPIVLSLRSRTRRRNLRATVPDRRYHVYIMADAPSLACFRRHPVDPPPRRDPWA